MVYRGISYTIQFTPLKSTNFSERNCPYKESQYGESLLRKS
jgi:hypothetical protein